MELQLVMVPDRPHLSVLKPGEYAMWLKRLCGVLRWDNLHKLMDIKDTDELRKVDADGSRTNRAIGYIHAALTDVQIGAMNLDSAETVAAALERIKAVYGQTSADSRVHIVKRITTMQLDEGGDVDAFIYRAQALYAEAMSAGVDISDDMFAVHVLNVLPPTWEPFVTSVSQLDADERTTQRILERMRVKAVSIKERAQKTEEMDRVALYGRDHRGRERDSTSPPAARGPWIAARRDKSRGPPNETGRTDARRMMTELRCYNCGGRGHRKVECSAPKMDSVMVMAESATRDSWVLDSGTSNHMCGVKKWFVKFDQAVESTIWTATSGHVRAEGTGNVRLATANGPVLLTGVLYVPGLMTNLVSVTRVALAGYEVRFHKRRARVLLALGKGNAHPAR